MVAQIRWMFCRMIYERSQGGMVMEECAIPDLINPIGQGYLAFDSRKGCSGRVVEIWRTSELDPPNWV
eukprot:s1611_g5.t1